MTWNFLFCTPGMDLGALCLPKSDCYYKSSYLTHQMRFNKALGVSNIYISSPSSPCRNSSPSPALGKEQRGQTKGLRPSFLISGAGVKLSKRLILNTWSWHSLATSQNRNVKGFLFSSSSRPSPGSQGLIFWCQVTTNKGPVGVGGSRAVNSQLFDSWLSRAWFVLHLPGQCTTPWHLPVSLFVVLITRTSEQGS